MKGIDGSARCAVALVGPLPPPAGGMANQMELLKALLRDDGVTVETVRTNRPYRPRWIGRVRLVRALFRLVPYLGALWRAAGRADLMHVLANSGWSWHLFAAPAVVVSRLRGCPMVVNYRGGQAAEFLERQRRWVVPLMRRAGALTVPSAYLQRIFRRHGLEAAIVRNLVPVAERPGNDRAGVSPVGGPRLLVARNLEAIYDVGTALRAFARVRAVHRAARLDIAGDGPERQELETLAGALGVADAVTFHGNVENARLLNLLAAADIALNPSRVDNTPISILEACALGVPVVSTSAGGIPDVVRDGESALLVEPGDFEALAAAVLRLLADDGLRRSLVAGGRAVADAHTWPKVREALFAIYVQASGGAWRRPGITVPETRSAAIGAGE